MNYGYSGYSLVRHMKAMVVRGDLGAIRLVNTEFAHGHHADAADADNPRVRWRYDPSQIGVSAQFADCGIHALHMASFVTGQEVEKLSADIVSCIASRALEDDAMVNFRMDGGTVGRLWTSSVAIGRQHGLGIQVFGEKGGLALVAGTPRINYSGCRSMVAYRWLSAARLACRLKLTEPHASRSAMPKACPWPSPIFTKILKRRSVPRARGRAIDAAADHYPRATDGLRSMAAVVAVAESGNADGKWTDARPPMFR